MNTEDKLMAIIERLVAENKRYNNALTILMPFIRHDLDNPKIGNPFREAAQYAEETLNPNTDENKRND